MAKLKNLEEDIKSPIVLYSQETNVLNTETGEYTPIRTTQVVKEHTRTSFIQLYTQNINFLVNKDLSEMERRGLIYSFSEMNYYNIIRIDSGLRSRMQIATELSQGSVSKAIKGLIDKEVFLKISLEQAKEFSIEAFTGKEYVINPNLVGRGSFKEMKNMRQTVVTNFDFETLTMQKEMTIETQSINYEKEKEDLLIGKSEIKHIAQSYDEKNNIQKTDITIADKEEKKGDYSIVTLNPIETENNSFIKDDEQEKNIIKYEKEQQETRKLEIQFQLDLINAENRKLELEVRKDEIELKKQEAKNKEKELEIEEKKIMQSEKAKQGTLFGEEL